mmetsp:Transcript_9374/g.32607  ORF Transcript_9374/g.32607 Transcript_9374/m.32607 type:complete len:151 (-) Transcript_9374:98-550(-)
MLALTGARARALLLAAFVTLAAGQNTTNTTSNPQDVTAQNWLKCSSLVQWCTEEEVAMGCTYEPKGWLWWKFIPGINADEDWPYCPTEPPLDVLYQFCSTFELFTDSCPVDVVRERWEQSQTPWTFPIFNALGIPPPSWRRWGRKLLTAA